jgi:hypothetical protein
VKALKSVILRNIKLKHGEDEAVFFCRLTDFLQTYAEEYECQYEFRETEYFGSSPSRPQSLEVEREPLSPPIR